MTLEKFHTAQLQQSVTDLCMDSACQWCMPDDRPTVSQVFTICVLCQLLSWFQCCSYQLMLHHFALEKPHPPMVAQPYQENLIWYYPKFSSSSYVPHIINKLSGQQLRIMIGYYNRVLVAIMFLVAYSMPSIGAAQC